MQQHLCFFIISALCLGCFTSTAQGSVRALDSVDPLSRMLVEKVGDFLRRAEDQRRSVSELPQATRSMKVVSDEMPNGATHGKIISPNSPLFPFIRHTFSKHPGRTRIFFGLHKVSEQSLPNEEGLSQWLRGRIRTEHSGVVIRKDGPNYYVNRHATFTQSLKDPVDSMTGLRPLRFEYTEPDVLFGVTPNPTNPRAFELDTLAIASERFSADKKRFLSAHPELAVPEVLRFAKHVQKRLSQQPHGFHYGYGASGYTCSYLFTGCMPVMRRLNKLPPNGIRARYGVLTHFGGNRSPELMKHLLVGYAPSGYGHPLTYAGITNLVFPSKGPRTSYH